VALEWVPAVSAASGAAVGAVTTWLAARGGRKHAETIAAENNAHAERMAYRARRQARLEAAYVAMLQMAERAGHWVDGVLPLVETVPSQSEPELPSVDEQAGTRALVGAHGTTEVGQLFDEYIRLINETRQTAMLVRFLQEPGRRDNNDGWLENRQKLDMELRPAVREKRAELTARVSAELRGDQPSSTPR
jgi:hypothetical protein